MADCARLKGRHKLTHYGHVPSNYDLGHNETQWPLFKSLPMHPASEACQRRQPVLLLLRTKMYEIASGCKKSVGVE